MKDQRLREMMGKLYRLIERYETPPIIRYTDEAEEYFLGALNECRKIYNDYDNPYARELILAFYQALGELFKSVNKLPLEERPKEPEQVMLKGSE